MISAGDQVVRVRDLCKEFAPSASERVMAVDGVSFELGAGEILMLVGPNGAGKTTTLKIIAGILRPTFGSVELFGVRPVDHPAAAERVGYLPEIPALYPFLTGRQHLEYFSRLLSRAGPSGIRRENRRDDNQADSASNIDRLLARVGLDGASTRRAQTYSRGMRVRLGLAIALLQDPRLLLLDEPFSGIDPLGRIEIRELLLELRLQGGSLLVSTHDLDEASRMGTRIGIMVGGRMRRIGNLSDVADGETLEAAFLAETRLSASSVDPDIPDNDAASHSKPARPAAGVVHDIEKECPGDPK